MQNLMSSSILVPNVLNVLHKMSVMWNMSSFMNMLKNIYMLNNNCIMYGFSSDELKKKIQVFYVKTG